MTTDPLDLDAIEARAKDASAAIFAGDLFVIQRGAAQRLAREDVPALVAEVRRLRTWLEAEADWLNAAHDGSLVTSDYPMIARRMIAAILAP